MIDLTKAPYYLNEAQITYLEQTIASMTVSEKIGQLFFVIGQDEAMVDLPEFINKYKPGGMMYRPDKAEKIDRQVTTAQTASRVPLFISANLESGGNGIVAEGTWVGMPLQIAATNEPKNAYHLGQIAGTQANQVGVNMAFAPIIDIDTNFRNPITNTRTFGSDCGKIKTMASEQIKGFQEADILPVIKHFPGDGVDERDQHLLSSVNSLSADDWWNSYGKLYQEFIQEGIGCVMVGHIYQPALERIFAPEIKDQELLPASCSKILVTDLLRGEMGFNGLVITDATPMLGYTTLMPRAELLVATINAGVDMLLFNKNIDEDYAAIEAALANGQLSLARIEASVIRILATKLAQGVIDLARGQDVVESQAIEARAFQIEPAHQQIVEEIARQSVTLVKNREEHLPILPEKYPRIRLVILGDSDEGGFKEGGKVGGLFKDELTEAGFEVQLYDAHRLDFHEVFEEGVADLKKKFDLALYVANIETASNQTTTRLQWVQLMAANAPWFEKEIPTVFVSTANPYHLFDVPYISTFINAYTGNPATVKATVRKLMGQETFEGISPVDPFCGDMFARL
ncbi:beta-hexosaminidase [Enterococcus sp. JM4C]|uniref:glycoside hydrolase family 3 protein n=1 Tax=Candidatus Enterococcus huntleyi TaxID=1857217 RepID=UPI00137B100C|nr:glycoside hydrolase family 3 N-terminal domain-containing protein [Enterococcus sp. JM4C]KAF1298331.1 beta-hexosaminidase [Enterococcus sp. JM4C]